MPLNGSPVGPQSIPLVNAGKQLLPEGFPPVKCPLCGVDLKPGSVATFIPVGPGPDPASRRAYRLNAPFDVASITVCWPCVSGEVEPTPERRIALDPGPEPEPRACPGCGRIMSHREATEQAACNDCHGGAADLGPRE